MCTIIICDIVAVVAGVIRADVNFKSTLSAQFSYPFEMKSLWYHTRDTLHWHTRKKQSTDLNLGWVYFSNVGTHGFPTRRERKKMKVSQIMCWWSDMQVYNIIPTYRTNKSKVVTSKNTLAIVQMQYKRSCINSRNSSAAKSLWNVE